MPNVGNLSVKLTANASEFSRTLQAAGQQAAAFGQHVTATFNRVQASVTHVGQALQPNNLLGGLGRIQQNPFQQLADGAMRLSEMVARMPKGSGVLPALGLAAGAAGLALTGSFWARGAERIEATADAAKRLGVSTEFASVVMAMAGSHGDEMSASLLHLRRLLGESALGSQEAVAKFREFGLDAQQLAALPLEEQFQRVLAQLRLLPQGAAQAAMGFELFGRNAYAILPQLTKDFDEFSKRTKEFGTSVGAVPAREFELFNRRLAEVRERITGISVQVASGLIPFVLAATEKFKGFGITGSQVAALVTAGVEFIATAWGKMLDVLDVIKGSLKTVEYGFVAFTTVAAKGIQYLMDLAAKLPDSLGGNKFRRASENIGYFLLAQKDAMADLAGEAQKLFDAPSHVEGMHRWFDELRERMRQLAQQTDPRKGGMLLPWNLAGGAASGGIGGAVQPPQALEMGSSAAVNAIVSAQLSGMEARDNPIVRQIQQSNALLISVRSAIQGLANSIVLPPLPQVVSIAP